ncbi:hypothetical protein B0J17DRAFT_680525 [Rhizoctonia solani]|nr:hypothetical protein B0J17DRAFT_680525 [Rhizoctonia solani]
MTSMAQPSYIVDFLNTVRPASPKLETDDKSLANSLVTPFKVSRCFYFSEYSLTDSIQESFELPNLPRLSDDKAEADKVLLVWVPLSLHGISSDPSAYRHQNMLMKDVPRSIIRSILLSDSYDILVPPNPSTAPYIAISYAKDTEEELYAIINNAHPAQDRTFLMAPRPGMTAVDRDEDEEENWYPIAEGLGTPSYIIVDLEELDDLEPSVDIRNYFTGYDRRCRILNPLDFPSASTHNTLTPIKDWSEDYALDDDDELDIGEGVDSSLELYGSGTDSNLTEFSDSE